MRRHEYVTVKDVKQVQYFNTANAFDTETTSIYYNGEKCAFVYIWALALYDDIFIGRTLEEFQTVIDYLNKYCAERDCNMIIYVHNLAYDFQFFRKYFYFERVFATDDRKPIEAVTGHIIFRCSYILTNKSLASLGSSILHHDISKAVGDLDYSLVRHSDTPVTDKELQYLCRDVLTVTAYIQEQIQEEKYITNLPLTNTGYVRRFCRKSCFYGEYSKKSKEGKLTHEKYKNLMRSLILSDNEYKQLKRAFQGGFSHAGIWHTCKLEKDVYSFDFGSSYPAVEVAEKFPMSSAIPEYPRTEKEFYSLMTGNNCLIFDVRFTGLTAKIWTENYLSESKCYKMENAVINNGRVVSADVLYTTLTNVDFTIISDFYEWESMSLANVNRYEAQYLPTNLISAVLSLYSDKTVLKGVAGQETEYLRKKGMLNSNYGMMVTDIVRDEFIYDNDENWAVALADPEIMINKYNKSNSRFLYYPWGVFVTAYARRNLFTALKECGTDHIYSDTDSEKLLNLEKHKQYFENYNNYIDDKLLRAIHFHKLPENLIAPLNQKGHAEHLGRWDFEGKYQYFKALGAKRYMTYKDGVLNITVSGLNKRITVPYIAQKVGADFHINEYGQTIIEKESDALKCFEFFTDEMYIPAGYTGKQTHTYIDDERDGFISDYTGLKGEFHARSAVHLEPAYYSLRLSDRYKDFIKGVKEIYR